MAVAVLTDLGKEVPPFTPHAISVSLPTWKDNVGYEEGEKRVVDSMVSGYPRFFIHLSIQKLARLCEQKFGVNGEQCLLWPTRRIAEQCRSFMIDRSRKTAVEANAANTSPVLYPVPVPVRLVQFHICSCSVGSGSAPTSSSGLELQITLFPSSAFPLAKQFWQHTGLGISSRLAERCLAMLHDEPSTPPSSISVSSASPPSSIIRHPGRPINKHYSNNSAATLKNYQKGSSPVSSPPPSPSPVVVYNHQHTHEHEHERERDQGQPETLSTDQSFYLEERYGRNLPLESAARAKRAMRRRIAGVLLRDSPAEWRDAGTTAAQVGPSTRGVAEVGEDDVFLFPTGMAAIWNAHQLALAVRPAAKSICFGFPYTDTLKILEKWGPGCHFFGHGLDSDIDALEVLLESSSTTSPSPPALALFTEFPSNPLLRCADLARLRNLADKYDFLIVVDETIGNFVNVEVLPYADIVVSSLSKIFSGDANVMGGSLVLNPRGRHYAALKAHISATYEDVYFEEDALFMERNSRDFRRRIGVIDANTEAICDLLHAQSLRALEASGQADQGRPTPIIKEVFYPKFQTRHYYDAHRVTSPSTGRASGGFGGLFSLTFTSARASHAFFDALPVMKGPSLGTNFTLACPYTVLAHFGEMPWAEGFGVEPGLVRVSVGMEDRETLVKAFEGAVEEARRAVEQAEREVEEVGK